ncbi:hypothetical protein [Microbulbifer agarilyticus]
MIYLESEALWGICRDDDNYYIRQLSGSMHSETEAIYKLMEQEVTSYLSDGSKGLSETILHFSNINNYLDRDHDRMIAPGVGGQVSKCILSKKNT